MRRPVAAATTTCFVIALSGCGGSGNLATESDKAVVQSMGETTLVVGRASTKLLNCEIGDQACLRRTGPAFASTVDEQLSDMDAVLASAEDGCAKNAGTTHVRSLRSFKAVSTAATDGDDAAVDAALDRAYELQAQSQEELTKCDFASRGGVDGDLVRAIQSSFQSLQRPSQALSRCEAFDCYSQQGARLEAVTDDGLDRLTPAIEAAENTCLKDAARGAVDALRAYRDMAIASQEGDIDTAVKAGQRGYDNELGMAEQLRACGSA